MIRNIYKIEFQLASGLSIGKSDSLETDNDVTTRRDGTPFIPGSSIAGVCREWARRAKDVDSLDKEPKDMKEYFGYVKINRNSGNPGWKDQSIPARVIFYDADVVGKSVISQRDNVALDEFKTAVSGAKFDREIVNAGTKFVTYFEEMLSVDAPGISGYAGIILEGWRNGELRFGGKTSRGLGMIRKVKVFKRSFRFPEDIDAWVKFNMYGADTKWQPVSKEDIAASAAKVSGKASKMIHLKLSLKQRGGISIRQYSTDVGGPDYRQLENADPATGDSFPVIPGSSWAGAIRHRMKELLPGTYAEETIETLFGYVRGKKEKAKSVIAFSESRLRDFTRLEITRNAIDRFTGGTVDGALYKEQSVFNGTCDLEIDLPVTTSDLLKEALAASLADLHEGFLAVGGETSVGRGLFEIKSINGEELHFKEDDMQGEAVYKKLIFVMKPGKDA